MRFAVSSKAKQIPGQRRPPNELGVLRQIPNLRCHSLKLAGNFLGGNAQPNLASMSTGRFQIPDRVCIDRKSLLLTC